MNEILSRLSFGRKFQYLTEDKVWIKWGDFTKYKDLDCWMKYYLDSNLKESVST